MAATQYDEQRRVNVEVGRRVHRVVAATTNHVRERCDKFPHMYNIPWYMPRRPLRVRSVEARLYQAILLRIRPRTDLRSNSDIFRVSSG